MKFLVERDPLIDAVNWVARSLSVRPIQTSLLGIVINVDDVITFTSSNLETTTEAVIKADILEKGRVLVPGRLLADIARALPDKPITFALEGTRVLVMPDQQNSNFQRFLLKNSHHFHNSQRRQEP